MGRKTRILKKPLNLDDVKKSKLKEDGSKTRRAVSEIEAKGEDALADVYISADLEDNFAKIEEIFKDCFDVVKRRFTLGGGRVKCLIVYMQGMAGRDEIRESILKPLEIGGNGAKEDFAPGDAGFIRKIKEAMLDSAEIEEAPTFKEAVKMVLAGNSVLFIDGYPTTISINTKKWETRTVDTPQIQMSVRGPQEAFVEDLQVNLSHIRRRIKTPDLKAEKFEIGRLSKTAVVVAYVKGLASEGTVKEVKERLGKIDTDMVIESGYIEHFIEDETFSPFPQMYVTERPDICAGSLAEGRIAIIVDTSPFVLIVPVTFWDFLTAGEDYYSKFYFASFVRMLRYVCLAVTMLFPSLYIAVTTFHQETIPTPLLVNIARARAEVPFPAVIEALLMEVTFEILREAGIRLPKPIGPSITIAGSIVIGQGVVQAGIVSQTMVIIVAITAIASFAIPAFNAAMSVRLMRFFFMIAAATLGIFGIIMGILALLIHMSSLRSAGVPYLSPFAPLSAKDLKDTFIMAPVKFMLTRPLFIQRSNAVRMDKAAKPGTRKQGGAG